MTSPFLALLGFYTLLSLVAHLPRKDAAVVRAAKTWVIVAQLVVFLLAVYLAAGNGVFTRALLSPIYIGLGLVFGHLIFGLSLLVTHQSIEDASSHFLDFGSVWHFVVDHPYVLSRFAYVGISEEIIWRAAALPLAVGSFGVLPGLAVVALCFSLVHEHFFKNSFAVSLEFLCFAILLSVLYHWTGSLVLVIIIHTARNVEIAFLEYAVKVYELGDEERAAQEIEKMYAPRLRRTHE